MTTNSKMPTAPFTDAARQYATKLRDDLESGGFSLDIRDVAVAFDAGAASQSALLDEAREALRAAERAMQDAVGRVTLDPMDGVVRSTLGCQAGLPVVRALLSKLEG